MRGIRTPVAGGSWMLRRCSAQDHAHLLNVIALLRTRTRQEFNGYKKPTILRRIQRRMGLTRVMDMAST